MQAVAARRNAGRSGRDAVEKTGVNVRVAAPSIRAITLPRVPLRFVAVVPIVLALLGGGWLWLRDSSFVVVQRVVIVGAAGTDSAAARSALESAARGMTTLHLDRPALDDAVARYPIVRSITVQRDLPHTLRITVNERIPVGSIQTANSRVVVADDGVLLPDLPSRGLPVIATRVMPAGARVQSAALTGRVALLAAAPVRLRNRVTEVMLTKDGLVAKFVGGPDLRFGSADRLTSKWIAVQRVLADPPARDAGYIDVRVPERPAAGGLSPDQGGAELVPVVSAADPAAATPPAPAPVTPTPTPAAAAPATAAPTAPATTAPASAAATAPQQAITTP